ncbi:MAG: AtpZ/AtpI family protein [Pseudomonadota bacterium]
MNKDLLKELDEKLKTYQENTEKSKLTHRDLSSSSIFVVAEILSSIIVGGFIGYFLDHYLHTKILFLLIFINLGLISSLYNIYKKHK